MPGTGLGAGVPWAEDGEGVTVPMVGRRTDAGSLAPPCALADGDRTGVRWRSLWRRTDYLGFPVNGYAERAGVGVVDRDGGCVLVVHAEVSLGGLCG